MSQSTLNERTVKLDQYLQTQMQKTSNQVRTIDLFTCGMKLIAGVLGALFLLAVIDGWVMELGSTARWISLAGLLLGALAYFVLAILPLLIRKINPVYAAQIVESAKPEMKNSLINYLLLRQESGKVSRRVVELVGYKAATDISGMPVESTVDKSHTIRAALVLTVLVFFLGAYKVLSPKDPFQTFARILAPSSDISKPARVSISQVRPGNAEVFFGQPLEVTAFITGTFDPDSARVVFSSLDGQIVDSSIRMQQVDGSSYSCQLKTGEQGIEQSLIYRVVAGDGSSNEYTVKMTSAPVLVVESIQYRPAEYMELSAYADRGVTTIKHYEGTEVAINAVANADIESCYIQLLREANGRYLPVQKVSMRKSDERHATGKFKLKLNPDRDAQLYTHYQLHLVTKDGSRNTSLAANRIVVNPDIAPAIFVDDPQDLELEVPVNSRIRFAVEAHDVDFKLSEVLVAAENQTRRLKEQSLPLGGQNLDGPVKLGFEFWPQDEGYYLKPGDTAYIQFAALDNRHDLNGRLKPNMTLSDKFKITITGPVPDPPSRQQPEPEQGSDAKSGSEDQGPNADEDPARNRQPNDDRPNDNQSKGNEPNEGEGYQSERQQDSGSRGSDAGQTDSGDGSDQSQQPGDGGQKTEQQGTAEQQPDQASSRDQSDQGSENRGDGNSANRQSQENSGSQQSGTGQDQSGTGSQQSQPGDGDSSNRSDGSSGSSQSGSGGNGSQDDPNSAAGNNRTGSGSDSQTGGPGQAGSPSANGNSQPAGQDPNAAQNASQDGDQRAPLGDDAHASDILEEALRHRQEQLRNQSGGQPSAPNESPNRNGNGNDNLNSADPNTGSASNQTGQEAGATDPSGQQAEPNGSQSQDSGNNESGSSQSLGENGVGGNNVDDQKRGADESAASESAKQDSTGQQQGGEDTASDSSGTGSENQSSSDAGTTDQNRQNGGPENGGSENSREGADAGSAGNPDGPEASNERGGGGTGQQNADEVSQDPGGNDNGSGSSTGQQQSGQRGSGNEGDTEGSPQADGSQGPGNGSEDAKSDQASGQNGADGSNQNVGSGQDPTQQGSGSSGGDQKSNRSEPGGSERNNPSTSDSANSQSTESDGSDASSDRNGTQQPNSQQPNSQQPNSQQPNSENQSDSRGDRSSTDQQSGQSSGSGQSSDSGDADDAGSDRPNGQPNSDDSKKRQGSRQPAGQPSRGDQGQSDGAARDPGNQSPETGNRAGQGGSDPQGLPNQSSNQFSPGSSPGEGAAGADGGRRQGAGDSSATGPDSKADAANLEYTRKATDLALEHLADQAINPDPKLLDRLNFTKEELQEFVKRYQQLRDQANSGDPNKRRQWENELRSLDLPGTQSRREQFQGETDNRSGYREDGAVNSVPPEIADRIKAFSRKRNRVRQSPPEGRK